MDATRTLLVRDGYQSLSMRKIASAVGCSVSSIYLYFANRDELVHALMDEGFERWYQIVSDPAALALSPVQQLERHCRRYIEFGLENAEFYEIMYMLHPEQMARFPKTLFRRATRSMDVLSRIVRECAPDRFRDADEARVHAHVVWAILHGVVSTLLAQRIDIRIDRMAYVEASIQSVVNLVRHAAPAPVAETVVLPT